MLIELVVHRYRYFVALSNLAKYASVQLFYGLIIISSLLEHSYSVCNRPQIPRVLVLYQNLRYGSLLGICVLKLVNVETLFLVGNVRDVPLSL